MIKYIRDDDDMTITFPAPTLSSDPDRIREADKLLIEDLEEYLDSITLKLIIT